MGEPGPEYVGYSEPAGRELRRPVILVLTGLPGTGKSTLGLRTASLLGAPLFSGDALMSALEPIAGQLSALDPDEYAAVCNGLLLSLATGQLNAGQDAVIDSIIANDVLRNWSDRFTGRSTFRVVECVVADQSLHQRRLTERPHDLNDWHEVPWNAVARLASRLGPWTVDRLVIDASSALEVNVTSILNYLES